MFGSNFGTRTTTSAFGQTSTFGKPATSFGTSAFGAGNTSLFGQTTNTQPSSSTLFGGTATAPAFGQTSTTSSFGFGSGTGTSLFGSQPTNTGTTGLFGSQNVASTSSGGLFGSSSTSAFGQTTGSAFGGFGSSSNSGLFGQTQPAANQTTSLFGQPANQPQGGLFSSTTGGAFAAPNAALSGTTVKFTPVTGSDTMVRNGVTQTISTKHHCISCMKEYEGKSLEELRYEDYLANRKGPQQGVATGTGLFGSTGQAPLFGSTSTPSTSSGLFGAFGQTSAFGTASAGTGLFGKPATTTPFGGGTTTTQSAFGTGFNQSTGLFGANTTQNKPAFGTQSGTGLFNTSNTSAFASQQPSTFGFGTQQPQQQSVGLFQQNKFGSPGFGAQQTSSGFSFGVNTNPTNTAPLFGAKPTTGFGATPTTSASAFGTTGAFAPVSQPLFGNTFNKPNTGFSFGQSNLGTGLNTGTSLFTANKPAAPLFGNNSTGLFGNNTFASGTTPGFGAPGGTSFGGNSFGNNTLGSGFGSQNQGLQPGVASIAEQIQALTAMPYGNSPLFKNLIPSNGKAEELIKPPVIEMHKLETSSTNNFKVSTHVSVTDGLIKRRPLERLEYSKKFLFDGVEDDTTDDLTPRRASPRHINLGIKSKTLWDTSKMAESTSNDSTLDISGLHTLRMTNLDDTPSRGRSKIEMVVPAARKQDDRSMLSNNSFLNYTEDSTFSEVLTRAKKLDVISENNKENVVVDTVDAISKEKDDKNKEEQEEEKTEHVAKVKLTKEGYYTIPSLIELAERTDEKGQCFVKNFTIGRIKYGNVTFYDRFDISGIDFDATVKFEHKEITIYPNEDDKPSIGCGLNRKAQVTLDRIWPKDKSTNELITDPQREEEMKKFTRKLQNACVKMGAKFVEYRPLTGSWVFEVEHFSKYGLHDSDDDEDEEEGEIVNENKKQKLTPKGKNRKESLTKKTDVEPKKGLDGKVIGGNELSGAGTVDINDDYELFTDVMSCNLTEIPKDYLREKEFDDSPVIKLARELNTSLHKVQLMKASFYVDDDLPFDDDYISDEKMGLSKTKENRNSFVDAKYRNSSPYVIKRDDYFENDDKVIMSKQFQDENLILDSTFIKPLQDFTRRDDDYYTEVDKMDVVSKIMVEDETSVVDSSKVKKPKTIVMRKENSRRSEILLPRKDKNLPMLVVVPKRLAFKYRNCDIPYKLSLSKQLEDTLVLTDAALIKSYTFKVGWSKSFKMAALISYDNSMNNQHDIQIPRSGDDFSHNLLRTYQISCPLKGQTIEYLDICLSEHLFHLHDGIPGFVVRGGLNALHRHFEVSRVELEEDYDRNLWHLMQALWGNIPELVEEEELYSHKNGMARKNAVSDWLEVVVADSVEIDRSDNNPSNIMKLLTMHKIYDACTMACDIGDVNLSLLISCIGGQDSVRGKLEEQIIKWHDTKADTLIDKERLKILTLIAGHFVYVSNSELINTCDGLDWKRAFGLHLWYIAKKEEDLLAVLHMYKEAFESEEKHVCPPNPSYGGSSLEYEKNKKGEKVQDLYYHLLTLYTCRSHPLDKLLNPCTYSFNILDYKLSWLVMVTLESIGYSHSSEETWAHVCVNFATQLETNGYWNWAVFVLLHIKHSNSRMKSVKDTIGRNVKLSDDGSLTLTKDDNFLINELNIPIEWIYYAKAVLAVSEFRHKESAWYYVKSGRWNEAHEVIVKHLVPEAIINERYDTIRELLESIVLAETLVSNWKTRGGIIWEYLEICNRVERLSSSGEEFTDVERQLEEMLPLMTDLCDRIQHYPTPNKEHKVCQMEILKRLIQYFKTLFKVSGGNEVLKLSQVCDLVKKMPLPEEDIKEEIEELIAEWLAVQSVCSSNVFEKY